MAPDAVLFGSIVVFLVVWIAFGGDAPARLFSVAMLAVTGTLLLAVVTAGGGWRTLACQPLSVRLLSMAILIAPVLMLIPLPPDWWQALPGRGLATASLAAAQVAGQWHPATLSVLGTTETALACWWLFGLALAIQQLSADRMRTIYRLLFGMALINVAIGIVQVVTRGAMFDFYGSSHRGLLIGVFANKNHAGLFTAIAILTGYAASRRRGSGHGGKGSRLTATVVVPILLVIFAALLATNSRAALLFGLFALGFVGLLAFERRVGQRGQIIALALLGIVCVAALFGSTDLATNSIGRFGVVSSDIRWLFWTRSWPLVGHFFPVGAGIGTFPTLFIANEQLSWLRPTYFNHAHNDYLEQLIELGAIAPVLWSLMLMAVVPAVLQAWRHRTRTEGGFALIGGAIVFLFLVHSSFDYPLRRPGTAALFVVGVSALLRGRRITTVARTVQLCDSGPPLEQEPLGRSGRRSVAISEVQA